MANISDMPEINALVDEFNTIERAIYNIDHGAAITSMVIGSPPPQEGNGASQSMPAQVQTEYMFGAIGGGMMPAIKAAMIGREQQITARLVELGVTGEARAALAATPRAAPQPRRKS